MRIVVMQPFLRASLSAALGAVVSFAAFPPPAVASASAPAAAPGTGPAALAGSAPRSPSAGETATAPPWASIGRPATPAEIAAWDIDVRADFAGLPPGSGSVEQGMEVWESKCASCHGTFGESNEVFTPIVGGTSAQDIETGRVANLRRSDFPQRTTLMKLSRISTLWDYINRAMPWNAPKSLSVEEVYAVTAYILNLGDIVDVDFVLSDKNMGDVQKLLPNRDGMAFFAPMWSVTGQPDVQGDACMTDCATEVKVQSILPAFARDAHGNLAAQHRIVGPVRGVDTTAPPLESPEQLSAVRRAARATVAPGAEGDSPVASLAAAANCTSCHSREKTLVGPSFRAVADRYRDEPEALALLTERVRRGGQGVWGSVPMPANEGIPDDELRQVVGWILEGAP